MAEYAKKTVAELTEILKSRGLPSSGKKAELIARLNEADKAEAQEPEAPSASGESGAEAGAGDDAEANVSAPAPAPAPAQTQAKPQPPPVGSEADTTGSEATYTLNLKASDVDNELAKRKARAERFGTATGTTESTAADEKTKTLERAKRFGTETTAISKLDEALPTERRKRKAEASEVDDPGLKKGFANRAGGGGGAGGGRFRGRGGRGNNPRGPTGVTKAAFSSEKDRLAAEARKKKFATA